MIAVLIAALALAPGATGCSRMTLPGAFSGVIEPRIVPSSAQQGFVTTERDFDFEENRVQLRVPVDQAVYSGAVNAEKSTVFIGRSRPSNWIDGHYRSFVDEKHQEPLYGSLAQALEQVRAQRGLDSSRYVELITALVQTMEYRVDPVSLAPKFPIETFADGYGDCDDKTLLAAALLSRAGYDIAILFFEDEKHVALGIKAPGLDYEGTGYAYVEMTDPSLVGVVPAELSGGVTLESKPVVVKIGSGEKAYEAAERIVAIQSRLKEVRAAEKRMSAQIAANTRELDDGRAAVESARQAAEAAQDPASSAAAIARYNSRVSAFNDLVARANAAVAEYNALVDAERYTIEHPTARPQIDERLQELRL